MNLSPEEQTPEIDLTAAVGTSSSSVVPTGVPDSGPVVHDDDTDDTDAPTVSTTSLPPD